MRTNWADWLSVVLLIVGALNWGIIGFTGVFMGGPVNAVAAILEPVFQPAAAELLEYLIYLLVGLAGLYFFYPAYKMARDRRTEARTTTEV
jgi:uncharacterized membrane protein YuzA (DUF378 family)